MHHTPHISAIPLTQDAAQQGIDLSRNFTFTPLPNLPPYSAASRPFVPPTTPLLSAVPPYQSPNPDSATLDQLLTQIINLQRKVEAMENRHKTEKKHPKRRETEEPDEKEPDEEEPDEEESGEETDIFEEEERSKHHESNRKKAKHFSHKKWVEQQQAVDEKIKKYIEKNYKGKYDKNKLGSIIFNIDLEQQRSPDKPLSEIIDTIMAYFTNKKISIKTLKEKIQDSEEAQDIGYEELMKKIEKLPPPPSVSPKTTKPDVELDTMITQPKTNPDIVMENPEIISSQLPTQPMETITITSPALLRGIDHFNRTYAPIPESIPTRQQSWIDKLRNSFQTSPDQFREDYQRYLNFEAELHILNQIQNAFIKTLEPVKDIVTAFKLDEKQKIITGENGRPILDGILIAEMEKTVKKIQEISNLLTGYLQKIPRFSITNELSATINKIINISKDFEESASKWVEGYIFGRNQLTYPAYMIETIAEIINAAKQTLEKIKRDVNYTKTDPRNYDSQLTSTTPQLNL